MSGIKETKPLSEIDPEMFALMQNEYKRQTGGLELIASEVRLKSRARSVKPLCQLEHGSPAKLVLRSLCGVQHVDSGNVTRVM